VADKQTSNGKEFDPTAAFRDMRDSYFDAWAKTMVDAVNSDAYAKATGMMLDTYLSVSSPFRQAVEKTMLHTLQQLSMPSRADVVALAERVTNIEMKLDDMDATLDRIEKVLTNSAARPKKPAPAKRSKKKGAK
jgi:hypothetical protein